MVVKLLLARGANPCIESGYLETAFMAAYCMGHTEIADVLRAAGGYPYPPSGLFRSISSASELKSLVQSAIVGSSDCDRHILRAATVQYLRMGQTSSSEEMGLLALKKAEIAKGGDHLETLHCCMWLASLFEFQNKYEIAEVMAWRARDGLLESQHWMTTRASLILASILEKQGKSEEAEKVRDFIGLKVENHTSE